MGTWGMGVTQSDEFCEVYKRFMERYNEGDEVSAIVLDILAEYHDEFSSNDGILHDVYFALAKAEWICCAPSERVQNKVKTIVESNANLEFYRELGSNDADLKTRRKNLEKFLAMLQIPRAKPRIRRVEPLDRIKELPPVCVGDCYSYKHEDGYRILIVLDRFNDEGWLEQVCCCILKNTFSSHQIEIHKEKIGFISNYVGVEFLSKSSLKKIAFVALPSNFRKNIPQNYINTFENKKSFHKEITSPLEITLLDLLKLYS